MLEGLHCLLADEAARIKQECFTEPNLRRQTANEKDRFKAEDAYRERRQAAQSDQESEGYRWLFLISESLKLAEGLREPIEELFRKKRTGDTFVN